MTRRSPVTSSGTQSTPTPLKGDCGPLTVVEMSGEELQTAVERSAFPQGIGVPVHVPEPLQYPDQLVMAQLKRCGGQEEHPIESMGHGTIPGTEIRSQIPVTESCRAN